MDGGGINIAGGPGLTASMCIFTGNSSGQGGGCNTNGTTSFTDCDFISNSTSANEGGGIDNKGAQTLMNCVFDSNVAAGNGGGVRNINGTETITNCVFYRNSALNGGGFRQHTTGTTAIVTNCTFYANSASGTGSAISLNMPTGSKLMATNCIFWGNNPNTLPPIDDFGQIVTFSDVQGVGYSSPSPPGPATGNISADPQFTNPFLPIGADGQYRTSDDGLQLSPPTFFSVAGTTTVGSVVMIVPTIAGLQVGAILTLVNPGGFVQNTTITSIGFNTLTLSNPATVAQTGGTFQFQQSPCIDTGTTVGAPATDILGSPRPINSGVDMGAYEFAIKPVIISGLTPATVDAVYLAIQNHTTVPPGGTASATPQQIPIAGTSTGSVTVYDPNFATPPLTLFFTWSLISGPGTVTFYSGPAGTSVTGPAVSPTTGITYPGQVWTNNVTMSFSAVGTYAVQVEISNLSQTLFSTVFIQVTSPPFIISGPIATPNGVAVAVPTQFLFQAGDPNSSVLTYLWNFGDGSTSTLQNPTHAYATTGSFVASVTATNQFGQSVTGFVTVFVGVSPGGTFVDSDGDGYPDELETFLGTSAFDAGSTPTAGSPAVDVAYSGALHIHLNLATKNKDTINLRRHTAPHRQIRDRRPEDRVRYRRSSAQLRSRQPRPRVIDVQWKHGRHAVRIAQLAQDARHTQQPLQHASERQLPDDPRGIGTHEHHDSRTGCACVAPRSDFRQRHSVRSHVRPALHRQSGSKWEYVAGQDESVGGALGSWLLALGSWGGWKIAFFCCSFFAAVRGVITNP